MAGSELAGRDQRASLRSPFVRLTELLGTAQPGKAPINLSVGEPRHPVPSFVAPVLATHISGFGKYPMLRGTDRFRQAAANWLGRRYRLPRAIDPTKEVLVLNGSREGLFLAALAAKRLLGSRGGKPAMIVPNPFYPAYGAGAEAAGCELIALPATRETNFIPDYDALSDETLARALAIYLCSPANPQGSVLPRETLSKVIARARKAGTFVFADECYSEIWLGEDKPAGALESCGERFDNVIAFNSLSKRSNLPGLRCGFAAGDEKFITAFGELRNVSAPQVPEPLQEVGVAAYSDEYHVDDTRKLYREKFDLADELLGSRFGHRRPDGGFFLWLDVSEIGDDETAARALWTEAGLRVVPGSYLARTGADGANPGAGYIRVALVDDVKTTKEALTRLASFRK
ncbi:MAG: aminotransferase class I/II-fold pyridoxal phosphate-dependent enzyme [Xanthobacteraceae bacterium]|nr:aminotransferase class I/II-fold pyridoxal phosphate-dependent enzyme [Xanthobacteraceae bacterium]QYK46723.1 MAG: aminotransferase class I/II-fold pyridoxal phosphate-dependent enzyme [Xanthobacteraceae bacterium]